MAVAITVSVAVAYWMGGIAGQYTKFEKVEIQSAVCTWNNTDSSWQIDLKLKNTGTATTTLTSAFINDIEIANYNAGGSVTNSTATDMDDTNPTTINSGASATLTIWVDQGYMDLSSGTTVNIKIHSAGGMDYIKLIELV